MRSCSFASFSVPPLLRGTIFTGISPFHLVVSSSSVKQKSTLYYTGLFFPRWGMGIVKLTHWPTRERDVNKDLRFALDASWKRDDQAKQAQEHLHVYNHCILTECSSSDLEGILVCNADNLTAIPSSQTTQSRIMFWKKPIPIWNIYHLFQTWWYQKNFERKV